MTFTAWVVQHVFLMNIFINQIMYCKLNNKWFILYYFFQHRTFVVVVSPNDKIARIRARILHKLFEIGYPDHQFRLRFKGQYLRDAFTIRDYDIIDNSIIKMIPLSKKADVRILFYLDHAIVLLYLLCVH